MANIPNPDFDPNDPKALLTGGECYRCLDGMTVEVIIYLLCLWAFDS